jgi:hypothetical protein
MDRLPQEWLVPGLKVRVNYGAGNRNNELLHIRGIVGGLFVTRRWIKHKRRWAYECKTLAHFALLHDEGCLEKA